MSENSEHMRIKGLVAGRLKEWFGCSIDEYPQSGHELDVYAITSTGVRIYVEVIWSPSKSHFLSDLLSIEHAETNVKLAIVNPKILENDELKRKFQKTVVNQIELGVKIYADMLDASLFLENTKFIDTTFKDILFELVSKATADSASFQLRKGISLSIEGQNSAINFDKYVGDLVFQYDNFSNNEKNERVVIEQLSKFNFSRYYVQVLVKDLINSLPTEPEALVRRWLKEDLNGLFIIGDFGTGKSTLCVHLAYLLACEHLKDKKSRIPIFISLRNVDDISKESILAETNKLFKISWDQLQQLSTDGKLVFILDGFDEIPERTDWKKTLTDFDNIIKLFCKGKSKVIVSCRTHFFKKDSEIWGEDTQLMKSLRASEDFNIVSTVPFEEKQIIEFIRKHTGNWEEIWNKIKETYNLLELSSRPLLADMIVSTISKIISFGGYINEVFLYDKYTEDWINREDWRSSLKPFEKARLMERLAFKLFCQEKFSIQFSEIKQIIENEFGVKGESVISDYYDYDIRTCSFFRRDAVGNYSFMHKSFLEFFVAKKIAREINQGTFVDLGKKILTNEIIFFLCKLLNPSAESTLIEAVLYTKKRPLTEAGSMGGNALKILDNLGKSKFLDADFSFCCVQGVSITCDFQHCNLSGLKIKDTEFESTEFFDCSLSEIEASSVVFDNCLLKHSNLNTGTLIESEFKKTEINDVNLTSSNFVNCTFKNASFKQCLLANDTFDNCKTDFINFASINLMDCKIDSCKFKDSAILCSIFSHSNGNNLMFHNCDLSGSCFFTCAFENSIFQNDHLAFSSFLHFENVETLFVNTRLYRVYSDNLDNLVMNDSSLEVSKVTNHEVFGSNIKLNMHTPVLCEMDKAVRFFNIDNKIEEKIIDNYALFWDLLKTYGKSTAMATTFYATLKNTNRPRSLSEVSEQFDSNKKAIAGNYRKLLISGYVKHVDVSPRQLIETYAQELKTSQESELLAKGIFDSAKKNRLPQGRDSATYATACLYLACKKNKEKITLGSLARISKLSKTGICKGRETIEKYCDKLLTSKD